MKKILILFCLVMGLACHKEYDLPASKSPIEGSVITIAQLKQRCSGSNSLYHFGAGDTNVYLTVSMDESSGNIYKSVFVKDDEGSALCLKLLESGGLYTGDRIRVNLSNCWLVCANNMVSIDSLDLIRSVVKLSSGNAVTPKSLTLAKLNTGGNYKDMTNMQSQLIELSDVEFVSSARGKTFANAIGQSALTYKLTDCSGKQIDVRTSGMSNFAGKQIPNGNGKFVGIVQQYNNEMSLIIRNYNEIQMKNPTCTVETADTSTHKTYLFKNFDDNSLESGGWLNVCATGTTSWMTTNYAQSTYYAKIYNKNNNVYEASETWLISPEINLSAANDPVLSFYTANSSTVSTLQAFVLDNYSSGSPTSAIVSELNFAIQKSSFTFFSSGVIPISKQNSEKLRIGFKYTGTSSSGSIWELDNIVLQEK